MPGTTTHRETTAAHTARLAETEGRQHKRLRWTQCCPAEASPEWRAEGEAHPSRIQLFKGTDTWAQQESTRWWCGTVLCGENLAKQATKSWQQFLEKGGKHKRQYPAKSRGTPMYDFGIPSHKTLPKTPPLPPVLVFFLKNHLHAADQVRFLGGHSLLFFQFLRHLRF